MSMFVNNSKILIPGIFDAKLSYNQYWNTTYNFSNINPKTIFINVLFKQY